MEHTKSPRQNRLRSSCNLGKKVHFFSGSPISLKLIQKNCPDKKYSLLNLLLKKHIHIYFVSLILNRTLNREEFSEGVITMSI